MQFNSVDFIIFFPLVCLIYWIIPKKAKSIFLLAAGFYFYAALSPVYLVILCITIVISYLVAILIQNVKDNRRIRAILTLSVIALLCFLIYYKYTNFILNIVSHIIPALNFYDPKHPLNIILPVGISFYIFQEIGYVVDVAKQKSPAERNIVRYTLFISFFPKIMQGPIERSDGFLDQLKETPRFSYDRVRAGLLTMLWGYFLKMVIADRCAVLANQIFYNYQNYHGMYLILGSVMYTMQIYADFSGYSYIAIGGAKVLGYELSDNFLRPYFATSVKDFWRRWHISLSSWLRDYVYPELFITHLDSHNNHSNKNF